MKRAVTMWKLKKVIEFGPGHEQYAPFCPEAPYPVRIKGCTYSTAAHVLLAARFSLMESEIARSAPSVEALEQHIVENECEEWGLWRAARTTVVQETMCRKFSQHPELYRLLKSTGEARLVYYRGDCIDTFLGVNSFGRGMNCLGESLMKVREIPSDELEPIDVEEEFDPDVLAAWIVKQVDGNIVALEQFIHDCCEHGVVGIAVSVCKAALAAGFESEKLYWAAVKSAVAAGDTETAARALAWLRRHGHCGRPIDFWSAMAAVSGGRLAEARIRLKALLEIGRN